jgi:P-type E1-E2 ATPase
MIPISLMVSLESVKFMQAKIIASDKDMETQDTNIKCEVQSSNLNEELGQIDFIFSDKTGTLTCNVMNFKKLVVGNTAYGDIINVSLGNTDLEGISFYIWDSFFCIL